MKQFTEESVARTVFGLLENKARKATNYLSEKHVVTATRRHKPDGRAKTVEILLTIGAPNFRARKFIANCKKAGEPFPVKKIQFQFWK